MAKNSWLSKLKLALGTRVYLSMVALILIALFATGITTILFFTSQNNVYHLERLQRKEQAVMLALNYYISEKGIEDYGAKLEHKIQELSLVHNLDFNIYTTYGYLIGSTQMDLFNDGTFDFQLSDSLTKTINENEKELFMIEHVGEEEYLSTYFTLYNANYEAIAIVNIPYRKDEAKNQRDLRDFLGAMSQVYILLFIGSVIIAYFLSSYITNSLTFIRDHIKQSRMSNQNTKMQWPVEDEIGLLIADYNRMVEELRESAEKLAKSEKESAWKEMAKQVAHEIKNPLTPMRLNIQLLQRSIPTLPEESQERLTTFCASMLEQIDTLSNIATSFSNFAKMPKPEMEKVDLCDLWKHIKVLYENENRAEVEFENLLKGEPHLVQADKAQVNRVLVNLIKNALQSIPSDRAGKILVQLYNDQDFYVFSVADNGTGVTEDMVNKLFEPNFTTKSSGMGLGLAMCQKIVEDHGGEIGFDTKIDKGSTFYFTIPKS